MNCSGYDASEWQNTLCDYNVGNFVKDIIYEPRECTNLSIRANDVKGHETRTIIYYTALTNGYDPCDEKNITEYEIYGEVLSEEFPKNTSYDEHKEIEISFTYMGVTATTVITQYEYSDKYYTINLNDEWRLNEIINPDKSLYDGVYESYSNYNVNSSIATMYIDIQGYETFSIYVRSYGESMYDYLIASKIDEDIDYSNNASNNQGNTRGESSSTNYKEIKYTGLTPGDHRITIVYTKDHSTHSDSDRGYIYIEKMQ